MKYWTVKIGVDESWIDDGFNLTAVRVKESILSLLLPFAFEREVEVTILKEED